MRGKKGVISFQLPIPIANVVVEHPELQEYLNQLWSQMSETQSELDALTRNTRALQKEHYRLKHDCFESIKKNNDLTEEIGNLQEKLSSLRRENSRLNAKLTGSQQELSTANGKNAHLNKVIAAKCNESYFRKKRIHDLEHVVALYQSQMSPMYQMVDAQPHGFPEQMNRSSHAPSSASLPPTMTFSDMRSHTSNSAPLPPSAPPSEPPTLDLISNTDPEVPFQKRLARLTCSDRRKFQGEHPADSLWGGWSGMFTVQSNMAQSPTSRPSENDDNSSDHEEGSTQQHHT